MYTEKRSAKFRAAASLRAFFAAFIAAFAAFIAPPAFAQSFREFPPALPADLGGIPLCGGRVQSIAVSPTNSAHIIAAHQFGGLWKTDDGGIHWTHLSNLHAVFVVDVAYGADGQTVIATLAQDNGVVNGGGIWISRDEGFTWAKPPTGSAPARPGGLARTSTYGISFAPDNPNRVYVATEYGAAVSDDNGDAWSHFLLNSEGRSVVALPNNVALVATASEVFKTVNGGRNWSRLRRGFFTNSFKTLDVSPYDSDKVFLLQNNSTLLLYEAAIDRWTNLPLPLDSAGNMLAGGRPPFVRVARNPAGPPWIDIWVGVGASDFLSLYKASCPNFAFVRAITPNGWQRFGRGAGLHDDCGCMGLDALGQIVMYGSDGGLFKPDDTQGNRWSRAALPGSGMNSYQITSLAGTNYNPVAASLPSLYFATQDNGLWASADGGLTWPASDCTEGFYFQTWHQARAPSDPESRVTYNRVSCGLATTSDAYLQNIRNTSALDAVTGRRIRGMQGSTFLLSPQNWIRFVDGRFSFRGASFGSMDLYLSTDNAVRWNRIGSTALNPRGFNFKTGGPYDAPTAYCCFDGARHDRNNLPRIALAKLPDALHVRPGVIRETDLIYLPDGGGLGERATEFEYHPVYGVDPRDPEFLIAPDVVNQKTLVSTTGGRMWGPNLPLLNAVTQNGTLILYDGHPSRMQVTEIAFSPYERNLILVGTRDAGVIYSDDRGNTWNTVPRSQNITYITGFVFRPDGTIIVSSYGRGLWKVDMRRRVAHFDPEPVCGLTYGQCFLRLPPDAEKNRIVGFPWRDYSVLTVFGGRINGLVRAGEFVKGISVTPGATYRFNEPDGSDLPPLTPDKNGIGFQNDPVADYALKHQEIIIGVVLQKGKFVGYMTSEQELPAVQKPLPYKASSEVPKESGVPGQPYLSLWTGFTITPNVTQEGGEINLIGSDFAPKIPVTLQLDGRTLKEVKPDKNGSFHYDFRVTDALPDGPHRLEALQKAQGKERKAVTTFTKVRREDEGGMSDDSDSAPPKQ